MPAKRKKAPAGAAKHDGGGGGGPKAKKRSSSVSRAVACSAAAAASLSLDQMYAKIFSSNSSNNNSGSDNNNDRHVVLRDAPSLLANAVWPELALIVQEDRKTCPELTLDQLVQLAAVLLSQTFLEGGVPAGALDFVLGGPAQQPSASSAHAAAAVIRSTVTWEAWCNDLFGCINSSSNSNKRSHLEWTAAVHCFDICYNCLFLDGSSSISSSAANHHNRRAALLRPALERHTHNLYSFMPDRYRELYIRQQRQERNEPTFGRDVTTQQQQQQQQQQQSFVVDMIQHVLHLMESELLAHRPPAAGQAQQQLHDNLGTTATATMEGDAAPDEVEQQQQQQPQSPPNTTVVDNGSDDLNDSENESGVDGTYDDAFVAGTGYRYGVGTDEQDSAAAFDKDDTDDDDDGAKVNSSAIDNATKEAADDEHSKNKNQAWKLMHRALELLCDLLSNSTVRTQLVPYLQSVHWTVRCRRCIGTSTFSTAQPDMLLTQQLLERVAKWMHGFPVVVANAATSLATATNGPVVERRSLYHRRAGTFQKMCHRHFAEQLPDIIYAGAGLLCVRRHGNQPSYLRQALGGLSDADLGTLLHKMRLVDVHQEGPEAYSREFLVAVLEEYLVIPEDPLEELQNFPLYPTERVLFDFSRIPPSHAHLLTSPVLSLPKLHTSFLSFADYLWRNFELVRLESAYEIRADLTDVIRRVRPVLRQAMLEDGEEQYRQQPQADDAGTILKTEFMGWARMALELEGHLEIKRVDKPLLGQRFPSQVVAEIAIDLGPCGDAIRREWDELGEYDNLFLVGIDARQMSGKPAPLLRDYYQLNHYPHGTKGDKDRRVADEDDRTFPSRFGVTMVRGCMILQVRDKEGTVLSDPTNEKPASGTKRIFRVALDPTQYSEDLNSPSGTDMYNGFNLVVRRHGKTNNFRSILETIRGLMAGMGSINRVIPSWLQPVLLGQGDPKEATCQSDTVKAYAKATAGVSNPDAYLDYGDTFLNETHLKASFSDSVTEIIVDGRKETSEETDEKPRCCYRVRMVESDEGSTVEAVSYSFPEGVKGNPVAFTPVQVAAIHSGLSPGLNLVVGPPGSGKTDVAVQIIASLYHSFPTQRTIVITHSNAALNDIFQKVMARGDLEERYLVRLGAGERDLQTESTHDFTKQGRVAYSLARRGVLLEQVQQLSESLGISGRAERGADGSPSYTCETADFFHQIQVQRRIKKFHAAAKDAEATADNSDVTSLFPFTAYFKLQETKITFAEAKAYFESLDTIFSELAEYRPMELLRSQRQRSDYLIMKQARVVAMTCTHAAIARSHLVELGFEYDNVVVEEAGQMLEIESFVPLLLQRGEADGSSSGSCRLKRVSLMGDHNQLPPVIQNLTFAKYSSLDQSMFARLIRWGVPYIQLDKQGRARPEIASLYSWRYKHLGNLERVSMGDYSLANPGFAHTFQFLNVENFEGKGETSPTSYFFQNVGEAEYAVALFQYMVLIGYSPQRISILTTYNGQKALIHDILSQRCGPGTPLAGVRPRAVSTVDQYQGQQNDIILLSLVRTESVGHLRDVRRLVVAVSRARLGLYIFGRFALFSNVFGLQKTFDQLAERPTKLQLVLGENAPTERKVEDEVPSDQLYEVEDVAHMGAMVHQMQEDWIKNNMEEC